MEPGFGAAYAPFLSEIRVDDLPEGPLLHARFDQTALGAVSLPFDLPPALCRAVPKRQAEFAAGRLLAHLGQTHLGHNAVPVGVSPTRAPIWPAGMTGSITHSAAHVAVWLSDMPGLSLGVDLEPLLDASGLRAVQTRVLNAEERALIGPDAWSATAVFSAKETLFKALYPRVQQFFGFEAAQVVLFSSDRVRLVLTQDLSKAFGRGHQFDVTLVRSAPGALTRLCVPWEADAVLAEDRI